MEKLMIVFLRTREMLARPENDFAWSSWEDAAEALAEVDRIIAELRAGVLPDRDHLTMIFLPTGPLQEVSVSSGWGDEFLKLAGEFDIALAGLTR